MKVTVRFRVRAAEPQRREEYSPLEEPFRTLRSNVLLRIKGTRKDLVLSGARPEEGRSTIAAESPAGVGSGSDRAFLLDRRKCLLVTSARPGEGKSTICANLALRLASGGKRVLLLDADLRRPALHKFFGVPNCAGLSQLLTGAAELRDVCQEVATGLVLLPSGPQPPDPQQLLMSEGVDKALSLMRDSFDMIVIDSPPVLSCSDAAILAPRTDGVIVVLSSGKVEEADVRLLRRRLEEVGATIIGSVLNRVTGPYNQPYHAYDRLPIGLVEKRPAARTLNVAGRDTEAAGWAMRLRKPAPFLAALAGAIALACAVSYLLNKVGI